MIKIIAFILQYIFAWLRLLRPGGARALIAENIALRKQLLTVSRHQKRSPKLTAAERIIFGILAPMISAKRLSQVAITLKPATFLKFHKALVKRIYHLLFSNKISKKPGAKGPDKSLIDAILEMKKRNPSYGYRRIAMQISNAFGFTVDKDMVRRL